MKYCYLSGLLIFIAFVLAGCLSNNTKEHESASISGTEYIMGTIVTIKLNDHGTEELLQECFNRLTEIEKKMSATVVDSDVERINLSNDYTEVSEDVLKVLKAGIGYGELSEGKFDITLGPVVELWGIGTEEAKIPNSKELDEALKYVNYKAIDISSDNHVRVDPGMRIDLGGIAKGYAADEIEKILRENNVESAIINLGGNIKVLGTKAENTPFKVGIQGPEELRNQYIGIVEASDKTIVTSGDYERYFIEDGVKYHHIFDPNTGYPVTTNVASVTVIAQESMLADAMSTILYTMTVEEGLNMVESMDEVECIYVTKDYDVFITEGLREPVFKLTDDMYRFRTIE